MPSGGARLHSGPAKDPNALRRDKDRSQLIHLPAAGRQGSPPKWPLTRAAPRELELWAAEWRRPQAIVWEANRQEVEVALYVRSLRDAEQPDATTAVRTLVKQQMDALGLTYPALIKNGWVIDDADGQSAKPTEPAVKRTSARERFAVIDGSGA